MEDVHNTLFKRLTSLTLAGGNRELLLSGLVKVDANVVCSYCKRPMSKQPKEFSTLAHIGENAYKQKETRCICCYAFSVNNPAIMGVEKAVAPNTAQRFGMMAGSGALIEVNRDRTWFFVPEGSAVKFTDSGLEAMRNMGVEMVVMPSMKQIGFISKIEDLTAPCIWINNFGRKTTSLIKNLRFSNDLKALFMCTDDELNSASLPQKYLNIEDLMQVAKGLKALPDSTAFLRTVYSFGDGRLSPALMVAELEKNPTWLPVYRLLPKDPHARHNVLSLAAGINRE